MTEIKHDCMFSGLDTTLTRDRQVDGRPTDRQTDYLSIIKPIQKLHVRDKQTNYLL